MTPTAAAVAGARPVRAPRRVLARVFAGDPRVWRLAAACALPLVALVCLYCAQPRDYDTGTNSVSAAAFPVRANPHQRLCVPDLLIPTGTARLRLRVSAGGAQRPALHLALRLGGRVLRSSLAPVLVSGSRSSAAVFPLPGLSSGASVQAASACLQADRAVSWGGTALSTPPARDAPTLGGVLLREQIAMWFLPPKGSQRSYVDQLGVILHRAALFRPGWVRPWLYALLLFVVLPLLAVLAVRWLALTAAGSPPRALGAWLFALAAVNFACWALITPPFQAPDEVDHFAYAQSLVERGKAPAKHPSASLRRWSDAETLGLEAVGFFTDHRLPDARPPWLSQDERRYRALARSLRPNASDGGGSETAASHGPVYYGVLAPAYLLAGSSPFSQLTLMRFTSALIGALVVLFTYLIGRELAPRRPWLAVIAALLVAYQPMYGFISGSVNNDVGINAVAAAVELLLLLILRRGLTIPTAAATGGLLLLIPAVKGTGMSLYPVAAAVLLVALWRKRARAGWARAGARALLALAGGALAVWGLSVALRAGLRPTPSSPAGSLTANASAVSGAVHNIPDFASYVWQSFLPRLPFMVRHFASSPYPAFGIFVERGWATFGWYTVLFPYWLYLVLAALMIAALALGALALRCERGWARAHRAELFALAATPVAVIVGFEAAYYSPHLASAFGEAGRYTFPAIGPLALLCVGALHAFGRRRVLPAGIALVVALIALSYASQLLTLTSFYA